MGSMVLLDLFISIHAPRVGSDWKHSRKSCHRRHFNPRSPCGERPKRDDKFNTRKEFQSTLPVWGATMGRVGEKPWRITAFQSTLPVWGATVLDGEIPVNQGNFNPRSPCGERPRSRASRASPTDFNPRSPCGERPVRRRASKGADGISIHAPRVGSDRRCTPSR